MMPTQALAVPAAPMPTASEWSTMVDMAGILLKGGLLPAAIKSPEAALTVMLKARELGIPPVYGLSNITVIQGKPTCTAELMLALIYRDHGDQAVVVEHSDDESCAVRYRRRTAPSSQLYAFSLEDAKRAGLLSNQTWQRYPAAMLRARCISAVARMAFPDSIAGMYTPDELGARTVVDAEGAVTIAPGEDAHEAPSALPRPAPPAAATTPPAEEEELSGEQLAAHVSPTPAPAPATAAELRQARALAAHIHRQVTARGHNVDAPPPDADILHLRSFIDTWQAEAGNGTQPAKAGRR